jgi:hypothetical protein
LSGILNRLGYIDATGVVSIAICVGGGDSASDIFEVFAEPHCENAHVLVRMWPNRNVVADEAKEELCEDFFAETILQ